MPENKHTAKRYPKRMKDNRTRSDYLKNDLGNVNTSNEYTSNLYSMNNYTVDNTERKSYQNEKDLRNRVSDGTSSKNYSNGGNRNRRRKKKSFFNKKKVQDREETKQGFMQGVLTLMFSQILIKLLGMVYTLYLTNREGFGDEGNGIVSSSYQIYAMLLTISSIGVPNAISKLVSERIALRRS